LERIAVNPREWNVGRKAVENQDAKGYQQLLA
jgi:hypothetical protein